jgi:predicted amidohydrolase YtcJ/antibiotic biosynthesis monooxygenase (ABM) superfamily enzyme
VVSVVHRVAPEHAAEFEEEMRGVTHAVRAFPGFLGDEVFRAGGGGAVEYRVVMRFASQAQLDAWQDSEVLRWWAERARARALASPDIDRVNGLEAWFTLPDRAGAPPPPKWKTAVVSAAAIYPIISVLPAALAPLVGALPGWLGRLAVVALMTPLMTWGVMPLLTRLFRPWLYSSRPSPAARAPGAARTPVALAVLAVMAAGTAARPAAAQRPRADGGAPAELLVVNARVVTLDSARPRATAFAVRGGRFVAVGDAAVVTRLRGARTRVVDAGGRTVIPGLNDSHTHVIRGGLNYHLELRWDGVPSVAEALRRLREQAARTPRGQWVRVVGGWSEYQFAERRMPTLAEVNAASDSVPVFVMYLYGRALLNRAALRALDIGRDTPDPSGGRIERDAAGEPTGLLVAAPSALILYSNLAKGPRLSPADQVNSTRHFLRELNRLGYTSSVDAGGGGQAYPDHYAVAEGLARAGQLPMRVSYYLFAQQGGRELADYERWAAITRPGDDRGLLRPNGYVMEGAGEQVVAAAADFENFLEPRPTLADSMEATFEPVVRHFVARRWPFRVHATYDESITRVLDVIERVNRDTPLAGLRFVIDHAETVGDRNLARIRALGGGVAVQHRMAYQGEHFLARYGAAAAASAPPVKRMLALGVPVGLGTDMTRVASYSPWVALAWLTAGRTVGGTTVIPPAGRLTREEALRLFTVGSAWISGDEREKGRIAPGQLADFAVLSADYLTVPDDALTRLESVLTVVGGRPVYGAGAYAGLAPALPPVSPAWSPVRHYGGYWRGDARADGAR